MSSNKQEVILGHLLNAKVQHLKSQVQSLFPSKKYYIGKLANATNEQGKEVRTDCLAVSMPEITECIAIWINPDLPTEEFNSILAEELFHHMQAYERYPTIVGLNPVKWGINFAPFASQLEELCKNLVSIICDLDAHCRMLEYGIDLKTILATDLRLVRNAISESDSSISKLEGLKTGKATVSSFPTFLLWWFDLFELGFPEYAKIWNEEIRPGFAQKLFKDTMECWDELTEFIHNNPVTDSKSAERALRIICERLVCGTPSFAQIRTSGRSVPHLC